MTNFSERKFNDFAEWWDTNSSKSTPDTYKGWEASCREAFNANLQDAIRYRWLRERDVNAIDTGGLFVGMTPNNIVLNGDDLDIAIDSAMMPNV